MIGAPSVRQKQGPSPEKWRKSVNLRGKRGSRDAVPSSSGAQQLTLLLPALPAGVVITRTGCILPADLTLSQWEEIGEALGQIGTTQSWVIGDWWASDRLAVGSDRFEQAALFERRPNVAARAVRLRNRLVE